jgi:type IV secretion system protein TrbJ
MNFKKFFIHVLVGAITSIASAAAFAQWTVIDPTNLVQNYSSAISGVRNEINTAQALIQQTQTAIHMAKSVQGLTNLNSLAAVNETLGLYQQLRAVDGRLDDNFKQASTLSEGLASNYGASDSSWNQFLTSRGQLERQQRDTALQRYQTINASLDQTSRQRQAIVGQLASVQGQTEAMQTLGAAIDVLIGQNQQIISILASNNRDQEINKLNANTDESGYTQKINSYQQRMRDAAARYKSPVSSGTP